MNARTVAALLTLAALWGASFLLMKLGAGDFGPVALSFVRVAVAAAVLVPLMLAGRHLAALRAHWRPIAVIGLLNSALPFMAYSYAALSITAGLSSVFNATSPLWGALVAWAWLGDRLTRWRVAGLAVGFAGVVGLAWSNVGQPAAFKPGGSGWAVVACLGSTLLYGLGASATKRWLTGVPPVAVAAGSQLAAGLALLPAAVVFWPAVPPSAGSWMAAAVLGALCTGVAYILYFRLLATMGPKAIAVTFLIPAFAVLWGGLFLGERVTPAMVAGCAVILLGTALSTGFLGPRSGPTLRP
jgi:drug/metabolite transporter (DMT)-like permease